MYTLQTTLSHFRFSPSKPSKTVYTISWYRLEENEDNSESYGVCLDEEELKQLTDFVTLNSSNFNDPQKSSCNNEDISLPRCGNFDLKPIHADHPKNFVLRRKPLMPHKEDTIFSCMDIELLNAQGELSHGYNLPFDIVGNIIKR